ncbi:MAG: hypothetical protein WCI73_19075, partial [Phycisphaerae bacterium]
DATTPSAVGDRAGQHAVAAKATEARNALAETVTSRQAEVSRQHVEARANRYIEQAKPLLEQALEYIEQDKYDLAEKKLKELDEIRDRLPVEWAVEIDQTRTALHFKQLGSNK